MPPLKTRTVWTFVIGLVTFIGGPWYVSMYQNRVKVQLTTPTVKVCPTMSLSEKVAAADVVLEATVEMVVPGETLAEVFLQTNHLYKGTLERPQRVFANPTNPIIPSTNQHYRQVEIDGLRFDEISFATGQAPYLLFLRATEGGYLTSRCDGSRLLGDGLTKAEKAALDVVQ